ncbi:MAG: hypothetical protein NT027_16520 [Proteobacteria bacterium]|nr:hypothetical protein [Pseudomonadota bacterium]
MTQSWLFIPHDNQNRKFRAPRLACPGKVQLVFSLDSISITWPLTLVNVSTTGFLACLEPQPGQPPTEVKSNAEDLLKILDAESSFEAVLFDIKSLYSPSQMIVEWIRAEWLQENLYLAFSIKESDDIYLNFAKNISTSALHESGN